MRKTKANTEGQKQQQVVRTLRKRILTGTYIPGAKLPTVDDLVAEFSFSRTTMQLAIRQLQDEGFVTTVNRKGLFATEKPPHLFRVGTAYGCFQDDTKWTKFYSLCEQETRRIFQKRHGMESVAYFGLNPDHHDEDYSRLMADISSCRLAGLVVHRSARHLLPKLKAHPNIPIAPLNINRQESGGLPVIRTDTVQFLHRALDALRKEGCKRLAVINLTHLSVISAENIRKAGFSTRPHWIQLVGAETLEHLDALIALLFDYPASQRPDGLLIANDHLTEGAVSALGKLGLKIGRDVHVVTHCNWPATTKAPPGVNRIGFHVHDFLEQSLELFRLQKAKALVSEEFLIPARFESEIDSHLIISNLPKTGKLTPSMDRLDAFVV